MAAGDINVVINSETKAFRQGVEAGIIKPLEDAEKALDDLGRSRGPDQLTGELKDAQRASEQLDKQIDETARNIETEFRDAYRKAGKASDDFKRDASGNVSSFKDEATQNLSEVASSFNGDLSDMASGVQGLTGGLASALTPGIGIPVAILGAAAAVFLAEWQKAAEESEQRVEDMYTAMQEAGTTFLADKFINDQIVEIGANQDKYNEAVQRSKDLGVDVQDVLRAMAGDQGTVNALLDDANTKRDEGLQQIKDQGLAGDYAEQAVLKVNKQYEDSVGWLSQITRDQGTAADKAWQVNQAIRASNDEMDKLADKWAGIPKSVQLGITVNSAEFDRQFNILAAKANKGISVVLRPDQGRAWQ